MTYRNQLNKKAQIFPRVAQKVAVAVFTQK